MRLGTALLLSLGLALPAEAAGTWTMPACAAVSGPATATFTADEGAHLAPFGRNTRPGYTTGLVALDEPNTLLAVFNTTLLRSTDAGCRWLMLAKWNKGTSGTGRLTKSVGNRAFAWGDGSADLVRIDGVQLTGLVSPASDIAGFGADASIADLVRLGDRGGSLWESRDGGLTWALLAKSPLGDGGFAYRVAFDPANLDHVVIGSMSQGAMVTFDGGKSWAAATGLPASSNAMSVAIAPSAGRTVYVMGIDLLAPPEDPSEGRHIYLSRDGGLSFVPVVDRSPDVTIVNGPVMEVNPSDPNVLYFVFGTSFENYGTDLFRYDALSGSLTKTHNPLDRVPSIAFNPASSSVMYLGVAFENIR